MKRISHEHVHYPLYQEPINPLLFPDTLPLILSLFKNRELVAVQSVCRTWKDITFLITCQKIGAIRNLTWIINKKCECKTLMQTKTKVLYELNASVHLAIRQHSQNYDLIEYMGLIRNFETFLLKYLQRLDQNEFNDLKALVTGFNLIFAYAQTFLDRYKLNLIPNIELAQDMALRLVKIYIDWDEAPLLLINTLSVTSNLTFIETITRSSVLRFLESVISQIPKDQRYELFTFLIKNKYYKNNQIIPLMLRFSNDELALHSAALLSQHHQYDLAFRFVEKIKSEHAWIISAFMISEAKQKHLQNTDTQ